MNVSGWPRTWDHVRSSTNGPETSSLSDVCPRLSEMAASLVRPGLFASQRGSTVTRTQWWYWRKTHERAPTLTNQFLPFTPHTHDWFHIPAHCANPLFPQCVMNSLKTKKQNKRLEVNNVRGPWPNEKNVLLNIGKIIEHYWRNCFVPSKMIYALILNIPSLNHLKIWIQGRKSFLFFLVIFDANQVFESSHLSCSDKPCFK